MPGSKRPPRPTPAELGLLRTLWALGPATVKQVHEAQQRERPDLAYANVLRLMQIMHGKGLLKRDERQRSRRCRSAERASWTTNRSQRFG